MLLSDYCLDWLKDKEKGEGWALAAMYRPLSKIPLDIWKAAPSTSNGNQQAHCSINRDGVKLAMVPGIIRGNEYDSRGVARLKHHEEFGINNRDQAQTHFRRAARSVIKSSASYSSYFKTFSEVTNEDHYYVARCSYTAPCRHP